jgi:hypothetical protein
MTLEAAFKEQSAKWEGLVEELEHGLLWSVLETKPEEEHILVTQYIDAATDLISTAREGLEASQVVANELPSLGQAGQSLSRCQERYNAMVELFNSRMASYGRLQRLCRFGREKGGAWRDWAAQVRKGLDRCRRPMDDLNRTLFNCWQEIAERAGMTSVSLQSTLIGPQIVVPEAGSRSDRCPAGSS